MVPKVNASRQSQDLVVPPDFYIELIGIRCLLTPSKDSLQAPWKAIAGPLPGVTTLAPGRPEEEVVTAASQIADLTPKEGLLGSEVECRPQSPLNSGWLK